MSRVNLVAAAAAVIGFALSGCSGMPAFPDWMTPGWMSSNPNMATQPLRFESDPPGADVHTGQGQTCLTPCALAVPSQPQAVTVAKIGYVPQTIQVSVGEPPDHSFWESPPPSLVPNPVQVVLQPVPAPPKPMLKRKPRHTVSRTRTAAKNTPPPHIATDPTPDPPPAQEAPASPFPPPPPTQ